MNLKRGIPATWNQDQGKEVEYANSVTYEQRTQWFNSSFLTSYITAEGRCITALSESYILRLCLACVQSMDENWLNDWERERILGLEQMVNVNKQTEDSCRCRWTLLYFSGCSKHFLMFLNRKGFNYISTKRIFVSFKILYSL